MPGVPGGPRLWLTLLAAASAGLAGACARQGQPPGGPEDRRPPVVVATVPDTFAVLTEEFRGPVRFEFDERVSERASTGTMDQAVVVSPRTGAVRVRPGRRSISVEMEGGFKPGVVYRVTLQPVVGDLFNNRLLAPFDLVFSTGADFNPSAVAGTVWDRTNAESVPDLEVLALPTQDADSTPYVARTDTGGVYVFRYLPPQMYRLIAYQDRNRNGLVDQMELQGENVFEVTGPDTSFVDVPVLQPDTTPARLTRALVVDSLTVLLEFDDFLEPMSAASLMGVEMVREDDGEILPIEVLHEREYVAWRTQLQDSFARLDSLEAVQRAEDALEDAAQAGDAARLDTLAPPPLRPDSAAQDSLAVAGDSVTTPAPGPPPRIAPTRPIPPVLPVSAQGGGARPRPAGASGGAQEEPLTPDGRPLPARRLVIRLETFLEVNAPYKVFAGSVVNINGVGGGGGESPVIREPTPVDSTAILDSIARADSAALADSLGVGDSLSVPDTVPPDTLGAPRRTPTAAHPARQRWPFLPERRR